MIIKEKWFAYNKDKDFRWVTIIPNPELDFPMKAAQEELIHLAPARVLGLDYAQYLYFLTIMFPEDIKIEVTNNNFPIVYWERNPTFYTFLQLLNTRLSLIMGVSISAE